MKRICVHCGNEFERKQGEMPAAFKQRKACSLKCHWASLKGSGLSIRTKPKARSKRKIIAEAIKRILARKKLAKVSR